MFSETRAHCFYLFLPEQGEKFILFHKEMKRYFHSLIFLLIFLFTEQSHVLLEYVRGASGVTRRAWLLTSTAEPF